MNQPIARIAIILYGGRSLPRCSWIESAVYLFFNSKYMYIENINLPGDGGQGDEQPGSGQDDRDGGGTRS